MRPLSAAVFWLLFVLLFVNSYSVWGGCCREGQPPEKGCIVSFYYTFAKEKRRGWYRVVFSMMFATQMMLLTQWCRFAYEVCLTAHLHIIKTYRVTNRQIPIYLFHYNILKRKNKDYNLKFACSKTVVLVSSKFIPASLQILMKDSTTSLSA